MASSVAPFFLADRFRAEPPGPERRFSESGVSASL